MKALAVGCHPDDLGIACGGTLRKYVEQGVEVFPCHIDNGNRGHVVIEPKELAEIRAKEFEAASAIIGAKETFNLNVGDMLVDSHDFALMDASLIYITGLPTSKNKRTRIHFRGKQ